MPALFKLYATINVVGFVGKTQEACVLQLTDIATFMEFAILFVIPLNKI